MTSSLKLGRIAGVEIGVNWSWLIVFALITWTLAVAVFPNQNPGLGDAAYAAMGAIAALLLFGSVLLHELGHALQARRDDVAIGGITLWALGGVARIKDMYKTPGAEFRIAVAGPLVTVAIAAVLLGIGSVASLPSGVDGVVFWLGYVNIVVLVFNLVPALPLDGGRILHSWLWRLRDDLLWATRVASGIGRGFGFLLIGAGLALLFTTSGFGGLWLAFIGWFLQAAAGAEASQLAAREALGGQRVRDLMSPDPVTVPPDLELGRFMDEIAGSTRFTTYPVLDDGGRTIGLLAFRCVAEVPRREWDERTIRDCMVPVDEVPTVGPDDEASEALAELGQDGLGRALVLEGGRLAGIVSMTDVARAIQVAGR